MTDAELDALEAAAKAATPGPWIAWNSGEPFLVVKENVSDYDVDVIADCRQEDSVDGMTNTAFIATANPAAILELIAELRQVKAELDWLPSRFLKGATCPSVEAWRKCDLDDNVDCKSCWLNAAKEATCQKN